MIAAAFLVAHVRLFATDIRLSEQSARWIFSIQIGFICILATTWIVGCVIVLLRRTGRLVSMSQCQTNRTLHGHRTRERFSIGLLLLVVVLVSQVWLPVNVLASSRSRVSPWPRWTAAVLHDWGISVRDDERFDERHSLREIMETDGD